MQFTRPWLSVGFAWLALGLLNGGQIVVGMHAVDMRHRWTTVFFVYAASWLVWACATPFVIWMGRRFPLTGNNKWRNWPPHLAACLLLGTADSCWMGVLQCLTNPLGLQRVLTFRFQAISAFYERFHVELIAYAVILAVAHTIDSVHRLAMRESELVQAQLDALRRQLEPHFLFNTLNGISGLVREQRNEDAVEMIAGLSELLRRVVEHSDRRLIPLAEEISFLERYVDLQVMRFRDRLNVTIDVPFDLYNALVPGMLLQPLVENAIQHGIGKRVHGGAVGVSAREEGGMLSLSVLNDGPLLPVTNIISGDGVGLANTRSRLRALYGGDGRLDLRNHESSGVEAIVRVPYRTAS